MLIRVPAPGDPAPSEITPESVYLQRRSLLGVGVALPLAGLPTTGFAQSVIPAEPDVPRVPEWLSKQLAARKVSAVPAGESLTAFEHVSTYNNFYEFGTGKDDPSKNAKNFSPHPWRVRIDGNVAKPGDYTLEDLLKGITLEDRVYRFRCVEAWSMVIPWVGFPLSAILARVQPDSRAKFVALQTLHDPSRMPGQKSPWLQWPYEEGLRLDEAMHPLTILSVGVYGRSLPAQNGAPLRLVVPWKYGFKSIKSIVRISLTEKPPRTTWSVMAPDEYGFFANVNPEVDHPRWSQARERRLPNSLFSPNWVKTRAFNGYVGQVAFMYQGMDLRKSF